MVLLVISIVLGILPLAGIAGMFAAGMLETVDGLFMSLILLTLSGVFLLNAFLEARDRGWLPFLKKKDTGAGAAAQAKAQKAS